MTPPDQAQASESSVHPLLAAAASAVIPGLGQWLAGDRKKARTLFIIDALILVVLVIFFRDRVSLLTAFVTPTSLAVMMIVNIALLAYRIWSADDAYRGASSRSSRSVSRVAGIVAMLAIGFVLVLPHAVFGYYDLVQYSLITTVFDSDEDAVASNVPVVGSAAAGTSTSGDASESSESAAQDGSDEGSDAEQATRSETTVVAPTAFGDLDRLNILLLGGDFGVGRTGIRTDTMIVVSLDPETGEAAMFQVPRNWTQAPLPEGMGIWDCDCYPELINELWIAGERWPEAFPGPGAPSENAVKGVISEFLGIPIHYYALVNLDGFVDLIDAFGGVEIYVPEEIIDEEYPTLDGGFTRLVIEPGLQHMTGEEALAFARTRHADSDYFRMSRQRCVLEAVMEQTDPASLVLNFGKIADVVKDTTQTDIPVDLLPELVELFPKVDLENVVSVQFIPPEYHLKYRDDGKLGRIANTDLVHEHVQLVIDDPARAVIELNLTESEECPTAP
jgi:LCP family protein required for cell wall assembly